MKERIPSDGAGYEWLVCRVCEDLQEHPYALDLPPALLERWHSFLPEITASLAGTVATAGEMNCKRNLVALLGCEARRFQSGGATLVQFLTLLKHLRHAFLEFSCRDEVAGLPGAVIQAEELFDCLELQVVSAWEVQPGQHITALSGLLPFLTSLPVPAALLDLEGTICYLNDSAVALLSTPQKVIEWLAGELEVFANGEMVEMEFEKEWAVPPVPRDIRIRMRRLDSDGAISGGVVAIFADDTPRDQVILIYQTAYSISELPHVARDLKELLKAILAIIQELVPGDSLFISLDYPGCSDMQYLNNQAGNIVALDAALIEHVSQANAPTFVKNKTLAALAEQVGIDPALVRERSYIAVPLFSRGLDRFLGTLAVASLSAQNPLTESNLELLAFLSMQVATAIERKLVAGEREQLIEDLRQALSQVKTLSGLLPICAHCKKVRDDQGYWKQIEEYLEKHSEAEFSHGLCPDCIQELYPGLFPRQDKPREEQESTSRSGRRRPSYSK